MWYPVPEQRRTLPHICRIFELLQLPTVHKHYNHIFLKIARVNHATISRNAPAAAATSSIKFYCGRSDGNFTLLFRHEGRKCQCQIPTFIDFRIFARTFEGSRIENSMRFSSIADLGNKMQILWVRHAWGPLLVRLARKGDDKSARGRWCPYIIERLINIFTRFINVRIVRIWFGEHGPTRCAHLLSRLTI